MSGKDIIIECAAPPGLFSPHPATAIDGLGEYARVIVRDMESGKETEIFRGEKFSEKGYMERLESKGESPRESRQSA